MINLNFIYSEIFLCLAIMILLLIGVFKKNSSYLIYNLSILSLFVCLALILNFPIDANIELFNNSYKIDYLSSFMKILLILSGIFVLLSSSKYIQIIKINKIEYPILVLSSITGMMVMISSNDLILFYIGLELQSLALYVLASFNRDNILSSESGLKYFVLSALSSGLLLYGCSLIYGFSGSTNFHLIAENVNKDSYGLTFGIIFIITGLAFKISAVPFHMWAPDVYEGSPTSVTIFFAILPKIAALTVFIRILYVPFFNIIDQWQIIIVFLSIASMLFGSIAAIGQKNLKRLIAYSSIGHMGYALAGISTGTKFNSNISGFISGDNLKPVTGVFISGSGAGTITGTSDFVNVTNKLIRFSAPFSSLEVGSGFLVVDGPRGTATSQISGGQIELIRPVSITSFSPLEGITGSTVNLVGSGFNDASEVVFTTVSSSGNASFTINSDSGIAAIVPKFTISEGQDATITVKGVQTDQQTASNRFTVIHDAPTVQFNVVSGRAAPEVGANRSAIFTVVETIDGVDYYVTKMINPDGREIRMNTERV